MTSSTLDSICGRIVLYLELVVLEVEAFSHVFESPDGGITLHGHRPARSGRTASSSRISTR